MAVRSIVTLVLSCFALVALAEPPVPIITSVDSGYNPVQGGSFIEIVGLQFDGGPCQLGSRCPVGPHVSFATHYPDFCCTYTHGEFVEFSDTRMLVRTPPQAAGWTDIVVTNRAGGQTIVPRGAFFGQPGFRRVLVPLAFQGEVPGANGSRWVTELTGRATDPGTYEVTRTPYSEPRHLVSGGFTITDLPTSSGGMFLYIPEGNEISLALRIRDTSREGDNLGTEIPLVTEEETNGALGHLLANIPITENYRHTLRVYNFDGRRAAKFTVVVHPRTGPEILIRKSYEMPDEGLEEFPSRPGYVEIPLGSLIPESFRGSVDIQLTQDLLPTARLWAMVSTTNNATQFVTMITPTFRERSTLKFDER